MSTPHGADDPTSLAQRLAAYYQLALREHANDPASGVCPIDGVPDCQTWGLAAAKLAMRDGPVTVVLTEAPP